MNAAEKEAWIADLESGKCHHGKKMLMYRDVGGLSSHCCLGVLVETLGHKILPKQIDCGDEHRGISATEFNRIQVNGEERGYDFFAEVLGNGVDVAVLYGINDAEETTDYKRQVAWIRHNVIPK